MPMSMQIFLLFLILSVEEAIKIFAQNTYFTIFPRKKSLRATLF